MHVFVGRRPLPGSHDDVALCTLRALRLVLRQRPLGDAVRPVTEILVRCTTELTGNPVGHDFARLAGLEATLPGLGTGCEMSELRGDRPRGFLAELVAADAIDIVHPLAPRR